MALFLCLNRLTLVVLPPVGLTLAAGHLVCSARLLPAQQSTASAARNSAEISKLAEGWVQDLTSQMTLEGKHLAAHFGAEPPADDPLAVQMMRMQDLPW